MQNKVNQAEIIRQKEEMKIKTQEDNNERYAQLVEKRKFIQESKKTSEFIKAKQETNQVLAQQVLLKKKKAQIEKSQEKEYAQSFISSDEKLRLQESQKIMTSKKANLEIEHFQKQQINQKKNKDQLQFLNQNELKINQKLLKDISSYKPKYQKPVNDEAQEDQL